MEFKTVERLKFTQINRLHFIGVVELIQCIIRIISVSDTKLREVPK